MTRITHTPEKPFWRRWLDDWRGRDAAAPEHLRSGEWGERQAEDLLRATGLTVLARRVRVGRRDEIDLLARDGETLVFVEVKTRRDVRYGRPGSAVDREKQRNLSRAAIRYMKAMKTKPARFRFDIVEIVGDPDGGLRDGKHLRNAFQLRRGLRVPW